MVAAATGISATAVALRTADTAASKGATQLSAKDAYPLLDDEVRKWASDAIVISIGVPYRVGAGTVNNWKSSSISRSMEIPSSPSH